MYIQPRKRRFETTSSCQKIRCLLPCCLISCCRRPSSRIESICVLRRSRANTSAVTRLIESAVLRMVHTLGRGQETRILAVIVVVTHLVNSILRKTATSHNLTQSAKWCARDTCMTLTTNGGSKLISKRKYLRSIHFSSFYRHLFAPFICVVQKFTVLVSCISFRCSAYASMSALTLFMV